MLPVVDAKLHVEHAEHIVVVGAPVDVILDVPVDAWVVVMWLVLMVVEIIALVLAQVLVMAHVLEIVRDHAVLALTTVAMDVPAVVIVDAIVAAMVVAKATVMVNVHHVTDAPTAEVVTEPALLAVIHRVMQAHTQVYKGK